MGAEWADAQAPSAQSRMRRWQYECERAGGDCAARVEALALRMPHARAVRSGCLLRLFTSAGPVEFVDGEVHHRYLGLLDPGLQHLVWQRGPEGVRFVVVGDGSGQASSVHDSLAHALAAPGAPPRHAAQAASSAMAV
ncbi:MAG: hypothetical protein ACOZJZ_13100 [Pseudomonadota bacterium]